MILRASARIRGLFARPIGGAAQRLALALFGGLAAQAHLAQAQVATTITLKLSNTSPTYTTPSAPGVAAPVTPTVITATVTETAGGKPVSGGTVTFYDMPPLDRTQAADPIGTASILGTPYLVPAGQATLPVALGAGVHTLTAIYNGTSGNTASSVAQWTRSATAAPLAVTVSGQAQSTALVSLLGVDGEFIQYDPNQPVVSGDLYVYGYGMQYPTGVASIFDQTTSTNYAQPAGTSLQELYSSLGQTITLNAPAPGVTSFILADPYRAGVPSIVAFYSSLNAVYTIDINRTQATPVAASTATGCGPCSVAGSPVQGVAFDMNNDGLLDIVVAHNDTSGAGVGVGILFNTLNPDPTVTTPQKAYGSPEVTYALGHPISYVAVGDVNGDGKPDIVALTADGTNLAIVLTNNGDGTFTQQPATVATGSGPVQIALADFNYDGRLDLAVLNSLDNTVGILLGNGNGTFQPMTSFPAAPDGVSAVPQAFTVARLANNHVLTPYLDIAVISSYNYTVSGGGFLGGTVLFGAGDGTFTPKYYTFGFGDFATNGPTFTAPISSIQAVDMDGDGLPDLLYSYPGNDVFMPQVYDAPSDAYLFEDGYTGSGAGSTPVGNFRSVGVAAGDVNGDGVNDIVLMTPDNSALYPGNPAKNAITIFLDTLYSQDQIPAMIAAPGVHSIVSTYSPAAGSIYAPVTTPPVVVSVPLPGIASFSANPVDFGNVAVGSTATQTLTITDSGTGPLEIPFDFLIDSAGGVYASTGDLCSGVTLAPGGTCSITLTFTPTATGPSVGSEAIYDTQIGSPQNIPILGTGTSPTAGPSTGTTIVLTSSNLSPNYVTPPTGGYGTTLNPVTLTATVTVTSTGLPVTGGSVTFYDNPGLPSNAGPSAIGTVNVQFPAGVGSAPNGVANLPFAFGPGPHNLTATYSGTPVGPPAGYGFLPATTAAPLVLTTNGFAATEYGFSLVGTLATEWLIDLQSSLQPIPYILNQDPLQSFPYIFGFGIQVPTGTVTVTDQTTGIVYPSTVVPAYANKQFPIYDPQLGVFDTGGYVYGDYIYSLGAIGVTSFFTADVFQSGVPALVTLSSLYTQVITSNLYSNPQGYAGCNGGVGSNPTCAVATPPVQGLASDINGDGRLDLVLAHNDPTGNGSVGIFVNTLNLATCGNACGAFNSPEVTYATGHPVSNVAVGDVNGDGYPDIVATSSDGSNLISILINNGDGTYRLSPTTFGTGNGVSQLALGDFNQDGILDIAVLNKADQTIGILNGNGDGTFGTMAVYSVGTNPTAFAVADLNLDGFLDFAITNNDSPTQAEVSFLYGAAGGTFNYTSNLGLYQLGLGLGPYPETNPQPTSITATDLDGDGYPDLVIGFNVNTFTYAMYQPSLGTYSIIGLNTFYDQPNGINVRTVSTVAVDLDGDGVKDLLFMPTVNNNIVCTGCSPNDNNLMVRYNGAMAYEWIANDAIDTPLGTHSIISNYTPSPNSIYAPTVAGPILPNILAEPVVSLTPATLNFGPQQLNTTSTGLTLTLQNTGNGDLTNIAFQIYAQSPTAPGGFTATNINCPATLAGGAPPCQVAVTFNPTQLAAYSGYVQMTYGAGYSVYIQLLGTAVNYPTVEVNETVHLTDTVSDALAHMVSVGETITLTDTTQASLGHPVLVAETIHLTDAVSAKLPYTVAVAETVHLTDTVSSSVAHPVLVAETVHLADAVTAGPAITPVSVNETIHLTDTISATNPILIADIETIHATDVDAPRPAIQIADIETIHATDTDTPTLSLYADSAKLAVSASVIPVGGSVVLTATVIPAGTTTVPTGSVNFYDGSTLLSSSTLAAGSASYTATALGLGTHTLSAQYLGDASFPATTSPSVPVSVTSMNILTVTPNSVSRNFGVANPTLSYTVTGFVNGDTSAVLFGTAALSTTATLTSTAGSYPITDTQGSLSAPANYVFSLLSGTLTVNGNAPETITFPVMPNVPLAVHQLTLTAHSSAGGLGQPVTYAVSGPATLSGSTLTLTGTGLVTVTASEAANSTFAAAASVPRSFTVTP